MGIFQLSVKNLRRKPARTAALLLVMAALAGALFSLSVVYYSVNNSINRGSARLDAPTPLSFRPGPPRPARGIVIAGIPSEFYIKADVERGSETLRGWRPQLHSFLLSPPLFPVWFFLALRCFF